MADHNDMRSTVNKDLFLDTLHSLEKMIQKKNVMFKKEELNTFFNGMDLSDKQKMLIYQYLKESRDKSEQKEQGVDKKSQYPNNIYFQMYLKNIQNIVPCTLDEENSLYDKLFAGDESVVHKLSDQWLPKILEIVSTYAISSKEIEDVVQEANMKVFLALRKMLGCRKPANMNDVLLKEVRSAVESYLKDSATIKDMDNSLIAKATLVHESQQYLAEELQRIPTTDELSQYTRLPKSELEDILAMAKEI